MPRLIDYSSFFDAAHNAIEAKTQKRRQAVSFKRKLDIAVDSAARDEVPGDERLRQIQHLLDNFEGFKRSAAQREFHEAFIDANLPHIYGIADYEKYAERILRERKIETMQTEVLVCCPRRFGKTTSVSMFVAVMLYCVPDTWISVFSTGQRASTTLLDQAARFFYTLPGAKDRVIKKNQEQFFIRGVDGSDVRRFHSFPSSVAGLKGQVRNIWFTFKF